MFTEVLAAFCEAGPMLRLRAATLVRNLHKKSTVTIHPQSRATFPAGLNLYEARPDKGYSLTDFLCLLYWDMVCAYTSHVPTAGNTGSGSD